METEFTSVGWQSHSAAGGGGGMTTCHATSAPVDEVRAWMQTALRQALADLTDPDPEVEEVGDGWIVRREAAGVRTVQALRLILPDDGGDWRTVCTLSDVPHDTTCIVERSTSSAQVAPPPGSAGSTGASAGGVTKNDQDSRSATAGTRRFGAIDSKIAVLLAVLGVAAAILLVLYLL